MSVKPALAGFRIYQHFIGLSGTPHVQHWHLRSETLQGATEKVKIHDPDNVRIVRTEIHRTFDAYYLGQFNWHVTAAFAFDDYGPNGRELTDKHHLRLSFELTKPPGKLPHDDATLGYNRGFHAFLRTLLGSALGSHEFRLSDEYTSSHSLDGSVDEVIAAGSGLLLGTNRFLRHFPFATPSPHPRDRDLARLFDPVFLERHPLPEALDGPPA